MRKNHAQAWKKWRLSKLMSQKQMALALGGTTTTRTIQNIEGGHTVPSLKSQRRFAALQERHRTKGKPSGF